MPRLLVLLVLVSAALACTRSSLESPQEVVLIVETPIRLAEHDATVAVRARNVEDSEALVNIRCEGVEETVVAYYGTPSDEVCGVAFEMVEFRVRDGDPVAAVLKMHFDDGSDDEAADEGEQSDEPSAEPGSDS